MEVWHLADYLRHHVIMSTRDLDAARESARAVDVNAQLLTPDARFFGLTCNAKLQNTALCYYRWSAVQLRGAPAKDLYCLQIHESGEAVHWLKGQKNLATPSQAVFLSSKDEEIKVDMRPVCAFSLRIDRDFIDTAVRRRFGHIPQMHEWGREFSIDRGPGVSLRALVRWIASELDRPDSAFAASPRVIAHIEKAVRALLLDCLEEVYPQKLRGESRVAPAMLKLIEEWMEANLEEAISVEDMAAVAGVGVRSVQAAFRRYRDCSPTAALLRRRLERARALLLHPSPEITVTSAAFDLGLCHLGRFSTRYRALFGEAPSDTLRRGRLGHV